MAKMGRKPKDGVREMYGIAKDLNIPKSVFVRNMCLSGFNDLKILSDISSLRGIIKTSLFLSELKKRESLLI